MAETEFQINHSVLSPCSSGRRSSCDSKSPEFEFWMVRNQTLPQPNLLSADELFSDGVILPLHLLHISPDEPPDPNQEKSGSDQTEPHNGSSSTDVCSALETLSAPTSFVASKRWKDIFKKSDSSKEKEREKKEKKEKKNGNGAGNGGNGIRTAELNINIWPFSRSRSAGNGGSRPKIAVANARKVNSAPCSRSNSRGESKSRKWLSSPNRGGVSLGRNSPVCHVRRGGSGRRAIDNAMVKNGERGVQKDTNEFRRKQPTASVSGGGEGTKAAKALQLNVPMCIGYKHHLGCRSGEKAIGEVSNAATGGGAGSESEEAVRGSNNLFNIRNLFTKKVH